MQVEKTRSKAKDVEEEVDTQEVDTSVTEEVVDAANCCLTEIEKILDEVDVLLPPWHPDHKYDPEGARPVQPTYGDTLAEYEKTHGPSARWDESDYDNWYVWIRKVEDTYNEREIQWHELRGLSWSRKGCWC